ncbi:MAG: alpha/beta hydrolase [Anaerolineales bacterium]|jgi:3-oxoadipate enol-lactonase
MPDLELSTGITLHYLESNSKGKETVLLLHGLGASGESWALQFPMLEAEDYSVLAPDARGFGHSSYPGGSTTIAEQASDFAALLEYLNTGAVHTVGISMGGTHALQLAISRPDLVRKLVLVNTFSRLRPSKLSEWAYFAFRFLLVHILKMDVQARTVAKRIFPNPDQEVYRQALMEQILQADPSGYRAAMRALARFNATPFLADIHCPTLVITAVDDTTVNPSIQTKLAQGIPEARQAFIPNAGHAVIVDQPEKFNELLLAFLHEPPE